VARRLAPELPLEKLAQGLRPPRSRLTGRPGNGSRLRYGSMVAISAVAPYVAMLRRGARCAWVAGNRGRLAGDDEDEGGDRPQHHRGEHNVFSMNAATADLWRAANHLTANANDEDKVASDRDGACARSLAPVAAGGRRRYGSRRRRRTAANEVAAGLAHWLEIDIFAMQAMSATGGGDVREFRYPSDGWMRERSTEIGHRAAPIPRCLTEQPAQGRPTMKKRNAVSMKPAMRSLLANTPLLLSLLAASAARARRLSASAS
jgi:hypothetical protein